MSSRILVSGVSGPIGTALLPSLRASGWSVVRLVRGVAAAGPSDNAQIVWDPAAPIAPVKKARLIAATATLRPIFGMYFPSPRPGES